MPANFDLDTLDPLSETYLLADLARRLPPRPRRDEEVRPRPAPHRRPDGRETDHVADNYDRIRRIGTVNLGGGGEQTLRDRLDESIGEREYEADRRGEPPGLFPEGDGAGRFILPAILGGLGLGASIRQGDLTPLVQAGGGYLQGRMLAEQQRREAEEARLDREARRQQNLPEITLGPSGPTLRGVPWDPSEQGEDPFTGLPGRTLEMFSKLRETAPPAPKEYQISGTSGGRIVRTRPGTSETEVLFEAEPLYSPSREFDPERDPRLLRERALQAEGLGTYRPPRTRAGGRGGGGGDEGPVQLRGKGGARVMAEEMATTGADADAIFTVLSQTPGIGDQITVPELRQIIDRALEADSAGAVPAVELPDFRRGR